MNRIIKYLMEVPIFYKIVQVVIGGEGHKQIKKYLKAKVPKTAKQILDQGCGTGEYALLFPKRYTGLDNNPKDIQDAKNQYKEKFFVGDASKLPFRDSMFDAVFAVGLHHHLTDSQAKKAIVESLRVVKKQGKIIVVDAMWPRNKFNLLGKFLRAIDRGRYVRSYQDTLKLFPKEMKYNQEFLTGFPLEYISIIIEKN